MAKMRKLLATAALLALLIPIRSGAQVLGQDPCSQSRGVCDALCDASSFLCNIASPEVVCCAFTLPDPFVCEDLTCAECELRGGECRFDAVCYQPLDIGCLSVP